MKEARTHLSYYDIKKTPVMSGPWINKKMKRRRDIITAVVLALIGASVLFYSVL